MLLQAFSQTLMRTLDSGRVVPNIQPGPEPTPGKLFARTNPNPSHNPNLHRIIGQAVANGVSQSVSQLLPYSVDIVVVNISCGHLFTHLVHNLLLAAVHLRHLK